MSSSQSIALARQVSDALGRGDRRGFRVAVVGLVDMNAALGKSWRTLAEPLLGYGEFSLARTAIERYTAWAGFTPAALFDQATVYARTADPRAAISTLERMGRNTPDRASNAFLRGTLALNLGDLDVARGHLLEALAARPLSGQAAYALASTTSMAVDVESAERILVSADNIDAAPSVERAMYHYALGKVHADRSATDQAFRHYTVGAALTAAARSYYEATDRAAAAAAVEGWDATAIDAVAARITIATDRPIIVSGLPRSGTTLVEQILVSHSAVVDGDEVGRFGMIVDEIGGPGAAAARHLAERASPDTAVAEYLRLLGERFPTTGRVVDKTLEASRYLGTLAALAPEAPILWVRRDPLARAWSCFSTYFLSGLAWTFDQSAIGAHFRIEDELLARWQDILGDRLHIVDYEALVRDKTRVIPELLAHCGLSPEDATLTPEATPRLVRTASVAQVRSPIGTGRIDAAERYRAHLQPFLDAYAA